MADHAEHGHRPATPAEPVAAMGRAGPATRQLAAFSSQANAAPAVRQLHALSASLVQRHEDVVQRVLTKNADGSAVDEVDIDNLTFAGAQLAYEQVVEMRVWHADEEDLAKIYAALHRGPDKGEKDKGGKGKGKSAKVEEAYVPSGQAELARADDIAPYLALIDHLAGEGGGKKPLKGGHLLSAMKTKYSNLKLTGVPNPAAPWEGWWSDGVAAPKWSSFFPSGWSKNELVKGLWKSGGVKGGRSLPDGTKVSKTGDTFFPWVNKKLPEPALKDMPPAP
jgi:hypothetical protein